MPPKTYSFLAGTNEATRVTVVLSKIKSIALSPEHAGVSSLYIDNAEYPYIFKTDKAIRVYEAMLSLLEKE